jgi:hypothetical protein
MQHQDLAVATIAGADANDRYPQGASDLPRQVRWYAFEDQEPRARILEGHGILQNSEGGGPIPPLVAIAA